MNMNKMTQGALQLLALTLTTASLIAAEADITKPKGPTAKGTDS